MCDARMKILLGSCRDGGNGTYGCHPLLGGIAEACSPSLLRVGSCLRAKASIRLDRHNGGVLCWEHCV